MIIDVNKKLEELMQAGLEAYEILVEEIKRPLDEELQDDRARNAMKAKKECFMDAREIMAEVQKLESIRDEKIMQAELKGRDLDQQNDNENKTMKLIRSWFE